MNAFIIRARTAQKPAPLQHSFAISVAVFDTPDEAIAAARKAFPAWSEFAVIGKAPMSVLEKKGLSAGQVAPIAWHG
jgi:hypothetical protein